MACATCGAVIERGKRYKTDKYKSYQFCSEDCYNRFCEIKQAPKPVVNFKPEKNTDRRKFTDFIQEWTGNQVNWAWLMKQAKDVQEEYELDWLAMWRVCYYARYYEGVCWDWQYGLGQIFPRYIEPTRAFQQMIANNKQLEIPAEQEHIIYSTAITPNARKWRERN